MAVISGEYEYKKSAFVFLSRVVPTPYFALRLVGTDDDDAEEKYSFTLHRFIIQKSTGWSLLVSVIHRGIPMKISPWLLSFYRFSAVKFVFLSLNPLGNLSFEFFISIKLL